MDHAKHWMIRLAASLGQKRPRFLFKNTLTSNGARSVSVKHLKKHGACLDPEEVSRLLYNHVRGKGAPGHTTDSLEELGACLAENVILYLIASSTFTTEAIFLVERLLVLLVSNARHQEAWFLALKVYHQWHLSDQLLGNGLLRLLYEAVKTHRETRTDIDRNQSILESTTTKLNLLNQPNDLHASCIPYPFRLWLSNSLNADTDPDIEWIHVRKFRSQFCIQKGVLVFWSLWFSAKFSGRWYTLNEASNGAPNEVSFDEDDFVTEKSFEKIFGTFLTTGIYEWTGVEDCECDCDAAKYLGIARLEELLSKEVV